MIEDPLALDPPDVLGLHAAVAERARAIAIVDLCALAGRPEFARDAVRAGMSVEETMRALKASSAPRAAARSPSTSFLAALAAECWNTERKA